MPRSASAPTSPFLTLDHARFQRAALQATSGGAVAGLGAHAVAASLGAAAGQGALLTLSAAAAAVALEARSAPGSSSRPAT